MATTSQNDICRCTARLEVPTVGAIQNVFYCRNKTVGETDDDTWRAHVSKWLDALYQCIDQAISNNVAFVDIDIYNMTQDRPYSPIAWDTLTAGLETGVTLPFASSLLVSTVTGVKRANGRKYFGIFTVTDLLEPGLWGTSLVALGVCVLLKLIGDQVYQGVTSEPGIYRLSTTTFYPNIEGSIDLVPANQRRRRQGTGI